MDLEKAFVAAAIPEPLILLRQRLRPYSIGHELILQRFNNALVVTGKVPDVDDLFFAVMICASKYQEALIEMERDDLAKIVKKWVRRCGDFDFIKVCSEFNKYRTEAIQIPAFRILLKEKKRNAMNAPILAFLIYCLMSHCNLPFDYVIDMPFGLALWFYCIHFEKEGSISLTTMKDQARIKAIREAMAKEGMTPMMFERRTE